MSRGFIKEGDQEEVPVVPKRAFLPPGMVNYVTPEGMDALNNEKKSLLLEKANISGNETDMRIARNFINAKLNLLEERIRSAVVVKREETESNERGNKAEKIGFGSYVEIAKEGEKAPRIIRITGADESDATKGFISYFSPLAKALMGHKVGDTITLQLPTGKTRFSILSIKIRN